jgi:hypothetical protein
MSILLEQLGRLSPCEQQFAERHMPAPRIDVEGAAKTAIKHMPLNDLIFMVCKEIDKRAQFPNEYCDLPRHGWEDWSHDAERLAAELREIAHRMEREGLV